MTKKKNPAAVSLGRLGGKARARNLTKEQLSAIGKKANLASQAKRYGSRKALDVAERQA